MSGTHVTRSFTLRALRKNRVRTAVTILGIALSAALLTAVLTTLSSLASFLYDQEASQQGAWHASVSTTDDQAIENARADSRIGDLSVMTDVGYAHLGEAEARNYGHYVAVQAIDGDAEQLCSLPLSEGRLPQNSHEIVLYSLFQGTSVFSDEPCQIGSQITMDLGARRPLVPDGSDTEGVPDYLDTSFGYFDPQEGSGGFGEEFVDAGLRQTYTVVGFYQQNNMVTAIGTGSRAFTFFDKDTENRAGGVGRAADEDGLLHHRGPREGKRHPGVHDRPVRRDAAAAAQLASALRGHQRRPRPLGHALPDGRRAGRGHHCGVGIAHLQLVRHLGGRAHAPVRASGLHRRKPQAAPPHGALRGAAAGRSSAFRWAWRWASAARSWCWKPCRPL